MATLRPTFAFVTSTGGAVMNELLKNEFLRSHVHSVVADRRCDALAKASCQGMLTCLIEESEPARFCERLAEYMELNGIDYVISFYTQFYAKRFRDRFRDRIINSHPSLLPSFKGMSGFEDGVAYNCKIVGSTVELISDVMDEGAIVMQTACAMDANKSLAVTRHRVFVQQCKSLLQTVKWIVDDRLRINGKQVVIEGANFGSSEFSPELDFDEAIQWVIPIPMNPR
jgi:phosphoribosylglycinamide formyltransferase-1